MNPPEHDRRVNGPSITTEQLEFFANLEAEAVDRVEKRYVKRDRRWRIGATAGFLILLGGVGYAIQGKTDDATLTGRDHRICERLNIVRAQSNVSDSVSFNILSISGRREKALIKGDPRNAALHRQSFKVLTGQAGKLTVTDLTDCDAALDPKYNYPLAGPIGDPAKGKLSPEAKEILDRSLRLVEKSKKG